MYIKANPNPLQKSNGDCVIRAISILLDKTWDEVYTELCVYGYMYKNWGNANEIWDAYLKDLNYQRKIIPDTCPICYTVRDFCKDNPSGHYLLATGTHVIACIDGCYIDSWDSGFENPIFYYEENHFKERK